jgi:hypothetical protein
LIEQLKGCENAHVIFVAFFPLPIKFQEDLISITRFQQHFRQFVKNVPFVTFKVNRGIPDPILRMVPEQRQKHEDQFFRELTQMLIQTDQVKSTQIRK